MSMCVREIILDDEIKIVSGRHAGPRNIPVKNSLHPAGYLNLTLNKF